MSYLCWMLRNRRKEEGRRVLDAERKNFILDKSQHEKLDLCQLTLAVDVLRVCVWVVQYLFFDKIVCKWSVQLKFLKFCSLELSLRIQRFEAKVINKMYSLCIFECTFMIPFTYHRSSTINKFCFEFCFYFSQNRENIWI